LETEDCEESPFPLGVEYRERKIVGISSKSIDDHFGVNVEMRKTSYLTDRL